MNEKYEYSETGCKIVTMGFNINKTSSEQSLLNFINSLSEKGIINIKKFSEILKESVHEIVIENENRK